MTLPSFTGPDAGSTSALLLMDVQDDMVDPKGKLGGPTPSKSPSARS